MNFRRDLSGLKRLRRNTIAFQGSHQTKLTDVLNGTFMRNNTCFVSLQTMEHQTGIEDFAVASDDDMDNIVRTPVPRFSY